MSKLYVSVTPWKCTGLFKYDQGKAWAKFIRHVYARTHRGENDYSRSETVWHEARQTWRSDDGQKMTFVAVAPREPTPIELPAEWLAKVEAKARIAASVLPRPTGEADSGEAQTRLFP